jgi:hypothetical protein
MSNEIIINKVATTATYAGSGAAVYFGLTANEIAAFGGLLVAVVGLIVTWYYKHQSFKALLNGLRVDDE